MPEPIEPARQTRHAGSGGRRGVLFRIAWTMVSVVVVETVVFGLALVPALYLWNAVANARYPSAFLRTMAMCMAFVPSYLVFALSLMIVSAYSARLLGWRSPANAEMKVAEVDWQLVKWARYMVLTHVVRVFVGSLLRSTPVWTLYMRMNGAKLGRGVYINSVGLADHNLLEFGDHVVIGDGVHLSGHTAEHGKVKTAPVKLGSGTNVGLGTIVGIGVETGPRCQIGALSLVPKFSRLDGDSVYVGVPVVKIRRDGLPELPRAVEPEASR